jgi:hypothetical protein
VARPKKEINYETVEKLANIQCTQEEIASFLGLSVRTLQRDEEFCRIYKKGQDNGKMSLRRMQYKLAEKNPSMAIWLGKQYLGQRDSFPDEVNYTEVNKGIMNIASLINNPVKNRTEKDVDE